MTFDPDRPYNELPVSPPKAEVETRAVLKELEGIGVLSPRKVGRENLYLNVRLYELLAK